MPQVYNFSAGPATLPKPVMEKAQAEFVDFRGAGFGVVEASHRSPLFQDVIDQAEADIRELTGAGDDYAVLFLQGGASTQFAMIPMNLMLDGKPAVYADTGAWSSKAIKEAKLFGDVELVHDGSETGYTTIGDVSQWQIRPDASYAYVCANNTINGTEYHAFPETGDVPLIADISSDMLSRPIDMSKFAMIYGGAQKNLGPAGVTLVIIRKDLAERAASTVTSMLKYTTHIEKDSMFNTPPTFGIYMVGLVVDWIKAQGGLAAIEKINIAKADALYGAIDGSDFFRGTAAPADRSRMNVTFRTTDEDLEPAFVKAAAEIGLVGLKGHRSVGGLRASIYNAMPAEGVNRLIEFMGDFERKNG